MEAEREKMKGRRERRRAEKRWRRNGYGSIAWKRKRNNAFGRVQYMGTA